MIHEHTQLIPLKEMFVEKGDHIGLSLSGLWTFDMTFFFLNTLSLLKFIERSINLWHLFLNLVDEFF